MIRSQLSEPARSIPSRRTASQQRLPGEAGTWVFILGDLSLFGLLFVGFIASRADDPELFDRSQQTMTQFYGASNTVVLLVSSLFVVVGTRTMHQRNSTAQWAFAGAFVCGLVFSTLKLLEWTAKVDHGFLPQSNAYFMWYFTLTGIHFFHLCLGLIVLALLFRKTREVSTEGGVFSAKQYAYAEGGACFWHLVDLLWIMIWPLLYLAK